jgi:hypothetical protein
LLVSLNVIEYLAFNACSCTLHNMGFGGQEAIDGAPSLDE